MAKRKTLKAVKKPGTLGVINNYKDQFVSINLKMETYFGLGEYEDGAKKLWLSPENWFDMVPEDLSESEVLQLGAAIFAGKVVLGKIWIPAVDKDEKVIDKYVRMLSDYSGLTQEFKDLMVSLFRYKEEGNYTALEIYKAMLEKEQKTRNRPAFTTYLTDAISSYIGPVQLVEDFPDDPDNYSVTIDDGVIVSSDRKEEAKPDAFDFKGFEDPERRSEVITKALG